MIFTMKYSKYILILVILILIGFLLTCPLFDIYVHASDNHKNNEITVKYICDDVKIEGMSVNIYKVAGFAKDGSFVKTSSFKSCSTDVNEYRTASQWQEAANEFASYIINNKISPLIGKKSGAKGSAVVKNLTDGLYLIAPSGLVYKDKGYVVQPIMFELPAKNSNGKQVRKLIINAKMKSVKPDKVAEELGKYAVFYGDEAEWLINQGSHKDDNDPDKLPQTGQLWWPVPIFAVFGMAFVIMGFIGKIKIRIRRCLWAGSVLCIGCAISLFLYNNAQDKKAYEHNAKTLKSFEQSMLNVNKEDVPLDISEMQTLNIDGTDYIGTIDIPKINIKLPVQNECTDETLKDGPCRYFGTCEEDNMIIAGHNMKSVFNGIRYLETGDAVRFTDVSNIAHNYLVYEIEQVDGYDCDRMSSGDWALTLFTCTYGGRERIAVHCVNDV